MEVSGQFRAVKLRVCNRKIIFLFLNQNICCGCSKEPSQWDGSFEHPKHMLKLWVGKYLQFYAEIFCFNHSAKSVGKLKSVIHVMTDNNGGIKCKLGSIK